MQLLKTSLDIKIRTVLYYEIQRHQSFKIEIKEYIKYYNNERIKLNLTNEPDTISSSLLSN
jgi:hypothetical protein